MFQRFILLLFCLLFCFQAFNKPIPFLGYGYYENLCLGLSGKVSKKPYLASSVGINPFVLKNTLLLSYSFSAGKSLFCMPKKTDQRINLQAKSVLWYYNNPNNRFLNFTVGPELSSKLLVKSKHSFLISAGVAYNFVLLYQRKSYNEVGWPLEIQPTLSFIYLFDKR